MNRAVGFVLDGETEFGLRGYCHGTEIVLPHRKNFFPVDALRVASCSDGNEQGNKGCAHHDDMPLEQIDNLTS